MGLFVCAKCRCVENTALGHWWSKNRIEIFEWTEDNEKFKGEGLCSECAPINFSHGSGKNGNGKWHNKFPKQSVEDFLKESSDHYKLQPNGYLEYIK